MGDVEDAAFGEVADCFAHGEAGDLVAVGEVGFGGEFLPLGVVAGFDVPEDFFCDLVSLGFFHGSRVQPLNVS